MARKLFLQHCLKYWQLLLLILTLLGFPDVVQGQNSADSLRLSPVLRAALRQSSPGSLIRVRVYLRPGQLMPGKKNPFDVGSLLRRHSGSYYEVVELELPASALGSQLLRDARVQYLEPVRIPRTELIVGNMDLSVNGVRLAQERFPAIRGQQQRVSLKEDKPDEEDLDIVGRIVPSQLASPLTDGHATLMATIVMGAGNSWYPGRGAAPGASLSPADFSNLLPEPAAYYRDGGITVQNHSYGVGLEPYYGPDAAAYDASSIDNTSLLHIFSAGNQGGAAAGSGTYQGLAGWSNLTGSFKQSKNSLSVGAIDSFKVIETMSSRGPAYDGRIKPELTAFGEDGSSGAAALVSGTALLLQQYHQQLYGAPAPNALLRNLLVNGAEDLGNPGPDFVYGFGNLQAQQSLRILEAGTIAQGSVQNGETFTRTIDLPGGVDRLQVALSWNDLPALPNAPSALLQDIDLELWHPQSGRSWNPWVLSAFPHPDSLRRTALRGRDSLNTIELISLEAPAPGTYEIRVRGRRLSGSQSFFLSWRADTTDRLEWLYPVRNDVVFSGATNLLRWSGSGSGLPIRVEYSLDLGQQWQPAGEQPDPARSVLSWQAPDTQGPLMLRMRQGNRLVYADTVTLSRLLEPGVGFSCADSFLVQWNSFSGADSFRVYRLQDNYLQSFRYTAQKQLILANQDFPQGQISIEPWFGGFPGARSFTFDHRTQGVACYIQSFRGEIQQGLGQLFLQLGTEFGVGNIVLEKWDGLQFDSIGFNRPAGSLTYIFDNLPLVEGTNRYRIRLDLTGGRKTYSTTEDLFYTGPGGVRIYPNLLRSGQPLQLVMDRLPDDGMVLITDMSGRRLRSEPINTIPHPVQTAGLVSGSYVLQVFDQGKLLWVGRFIVTR